MKLAPPVRVVGVGSPNGDDAIAWHVVARLEDTLHERTGLEFHRVDGGQRLLDILDGRGSLLVIDAVVDGSTIGTMTRLSWPNERLDCLRPGSTHDLGPATALRLAATLGTLPQTVIIYGIAAGSFEPGEDCGRKLTDAVPSLVRRLARDLEDHCTGRESSCTKPAS